MKKFVIVGLRSTQGGPIVLEVLCRLLIEAGCDARMFYLRDEFPRSLPLTSGQEAFAAYYWEYHKFEQRMQRRANYWKQIGARYEKKYQPYIYRPVGDLPVWDKPYVDDDTIVVYPESTPGNFLGAKKVVRWLLYHYQFAAYPGVAYGPSDLFIAYREVYNDWKLNPKGYTVNVLYFPDQLYRDRGYADRQGDCYIVRKGWNRRDLPSLEGNVVIDSMMETEIAETFNRVKRCISYDTQTFYSTLAALCGCESIVVPEPGKKRSDYIKEGDISWGIAYGDSPEELAYAKETLPKLRESFLQNQQENHKQAARFISICNEYFGLH